MTHEQARYRVFTRRWWKDDPRYPNGLAPNPKARKRTLCHVSTREEAIAVCDEYNRTHKPGRYSVKAEFMKV